MWKRTRIYKRAGVHVVTPVSSQKNRLAPGLYRVVKVLKILSAPRSAAMQCSVCPPEIGSVAASAVLLTASIAGEDTFTCACTVCLLVAVIKKVIFGSIMLKPDTVSA